MTGRVSGRGEDGFTLVEMLVVTALLGVVLLALSSTFVSGSQTTTLAVGRAELQQETVNAQQLIASRVKEAWYVFPPSTALTLAATNAPLRRNPITGNASWTVGTHPLLALVLPPRLPPGTTSATTCAPSNNDYCYRFFAYYPVLRSVWVTGTTDSGKQSTSNPGIDAANASAWVLVEYRDYYYESNPPATALATLTLPPVADSDANLLSDYVAPTTNVGSGVNYRMFDYVLNSTGTSVTGLKINLATQRQMNGRVVRLPDPAGAYALSVYPQNLGRVAIP